MFLLKEQVLSNPREECEKVEGTWKVFSNDCADSCYLAEDLRENVSYACGASETLSCDCGQERCWNGKTCEQIIEKIPCQTDSDCPENRICTSFDGKEWLCRSGMYGCYFYDPTNLEKRRCEL
jgi:hypothetical protein